MTDTATLPAAVGHQASTKEVQTVLPGRRLNPCTRRVTPESIAALRDVPTPNISDSLGRVSCAGVGLHPMHNRGRMIGRAITVRVPAGDNLLAYKGILAAEPGDVLVVDAGGAIDRATVGEIMTTWAAARGLAGLVVFGAIRDVDIVSANDFPVYALGVTHRGPFKNGPGELNVTVSLGGMLVSPGDLVVGDASGVVVVPYEDISYVVREAVAIQRREDAIVRSIREGRYVDAWVDEALRDAGYQL